MSDKRGSSRGVWCTAVLVLALLASLVTLPWSMQWYNVQTTDVAVRHPPALRSVVPLERLPRGAAPSAWTRLAHRGFSWFGHDDLGRSILYRLLPALLISLLIGVAAALVSATIGTIWGATAGLLGGWVDLLLMRVVDLLFSLPYTLMIILMQMALTPLLRNCLGASRRGTDLVILLLAIGGVSWLSMARVIRGQVLSLKSQAFIDAARLAGAGPVRILWRHLLPNLVGPIAVYAGLIIPQAILQEAFLSFLGLGVQPPVPSLGRLAADGVQSVNAYVSFWWMLLFPCAMTIVILLSLNFAADALRERWDPRSRAAVQ